MNIFKFKFITKAPETIAIADLFTTKHPWVWCLTLVLFWKKIVIRCFQPKLTKKSFLHLFILKKKHYHYSCNCYDTREQKFLGLPVTRNRKVKTPRLAIIIPGTTNDQPHATSTKAPAIREPRMLPTDVCEFQMPMISPRLKTRELMINFLSVYRDIC